MVHLYLTRILGGGSTVFYFILRFFLRERGRNRTSMRELNINCLGYGQHTPYQGSSLKPGRMPWPVITPANFWCMDYVQPIGPHQPGQTQCFSKMRRGFLSSARVQNLHGDEDNEAQHRNCLAYHHKASWCQSQPNPGVQIPFIKTYCLKWVDFVREIVPKPRGFNLPSLGEMILL